MATYRGQDGWVAIAGNVVGEVKSFDISIRQDAQDRTAMPSKWRQLRGGLKHATGKMSCQFDYGDTEQKKFHDNVLITDGTSLTDCGFYTDDGKFIAGSILVTETSPKASTTTLFMVDLTFEFDDEVTITWA